MKLCTRQMIALGQVPGQPAATNMKEMVWDEELAVIAQRWADQCMPGHDHRSITTLRLKAKEQMEIFKESCFNR